MEESNENIRRWILQILYVESNTVGDVRHLSPSNLSTILDVPVLKINENIEYLSDKDLVSQAIEWVKLTEKGLWAISQYERTFCPYL